MPSVREPFAQSALVRTFRVAQTEGREGRSLESLGCSRAIRTHLDKDILLHDRHLDCLLQKEITFTAVSHAWDPKVLATQMQQRHSPQPAGVRRHTIESDEDGEELWHDYLSVPQWTGDIKTGILAAIHKIFSSAATALFYFHDPSAEAVRKLRYGESSDERKLDDLVFLGRLGEVWDEELKKHQSVYDLARKVHIGRNLVPWNLGPLAKVKALKRTNFAMAFALLSKRECCDQSDFLYALSGIVTTAPQVPFRTDVRTKIVELARRCIGAGDYSPLLMIPDLGDTDPRAHPDYALNTG
ncbi:hypothetical protein MMYC01_200198 [Madurella mycetomatis]|uniref:Uncharacterized protein n=1 Tax=Madurella mycetomatis TaxID=100816 RepID=A0A175WIQ7_9PEZI|nr:hypothetical protein MMYC01_200198 [Madurella mycetomatis]